MRNTFLLLTILGLAACRAHTPGSVPLEGTGVHGGNGGDLADYLGNSSWFQGTAPVTACFDRASDFELPLEEAKAAFRAAVKQWSDYYTALRVDMGQFAPSFDFRINGTCTGREDLVVKLGVVDDESRATRKLYVDPVAFAHRTSFDSARGRGRGYIWVAPSATLPPLADCNSRQIFTEGGRYQSGCVGLLQPTGLWRVRGTLQATFVHELGHVLGVRHTRNTIMDVDFVGRLAGAFDVAHNGGEPGDITPIDGSSALVKFLLKGVPVKGRFGRKRTGAEGNFQERQPLALFRKMTGRDASGTVEAELERTPEDKFILRLTDTQGTVPVTMRLVHTYKSEDERDVFFAAREPRQDSWMPFAAAMLRTESSTMVAYLRCADGQEVPVLLMRNTTNPHVGSPLALHMLVDGGIKTIFER